MGRLVGVEGGKRLEGLHDEIRRCPKCPLSRTRIKAVPGEGPGGAGVMFVGEAPGREEDLQGRPFVGRAGRLLTQQLVAIGLRREEVFIGNVVKCRPVAPSGRDRKPTRSEIEVCSPYLRLQIEILNPRILCPLGETAASYILPLYGFEPRRIGEIHGHPLEAGGVTIYPMFHPAAALYTPRLRKSIEEDFKGLKALMERICFDAVGLEVEGFGGG